MLGLEYFGFRELWSPIYLMGIIIIAALYLLAVGPYRSRFKDSEPVPLNKQIFFLLGLFIFYFAQAGPLNLLAHLIFSAHMTAMALSYLIAPPLLLLGLPSWLIKPVIMHKNVFPTFRKMTHPILTLVVFNMLFSLYHIPMVHDYVMVNYTIHYIYYFVLLIASLLMWWNVVDPIPELERINDVRKMGYIFANGVLLTPACALIIFAGSPIYATYSDPNVWATALGYCVPHNAATILDNFQGPQFFALFDPLDDQQLGGIIMKLIQEFMYGGILFLVFYRWFRRENPTSVDPIH